jgi:hypothetical protein
LTGKIIEKNECYLIKKEKFYISKLLPRLPVISKINQGDIFLPVSLKSSQVVGAGALACPPWTAEGGCPYTRVVAPERLRAGKRSASRLWEPP